MRKLMGAWVMTAAALCVAVGFVGCESSETQPLEEPATEASEAGEWISAFNGKEGKLYYQEVSNGGMEWCLNDHRSFNDKRLTRTDDLQNHFDNNIVAFTVIGTHEQIKPLASEMRNAYAGELQMHFFENPYLLS